jgi:hypothetical protein
MSAEQLCRRYSGVTWHAGKWLVKFRRDGRNLHFGHYEDLELAAWVADFARYMCFGLNPAKWYHRVGRPNSPPGYRDDFPRVVVLMKLVQLSVLQPETLQARLAEYDAVATQNTAQCACR